MCTVSSLLTVPGYRYVTEIRPHTRFSMANVDQTERKRTTKTSVCELSWQWQLICAMEQEVRSQTRTVKCLLACKQRPRTLSCKNHAAAIAEQR